MYQQEIPCLEQILCQVQNLEQTQEVRLPEGISGVQRILGTWGQAVIRSKEWQRDCIRVSGGVMVWVLYEPESGEALQCLEGWIPFRMDWDLPEGCREGSILLRSLLRSVDARPVSAGKVLLRAGVAILAQCCSPGILRTVKPEDVSPDVQLLRRTWPVSLLKEAGERAFDLEEELALPPSVPKLHKLAAFHLEPEVRDWELLGDRLVFRGQGNLHIVYLSPEGQLGTWEFPLPFSQYVRLDQAYGPEARVEIVPGVTALELDADPEGKLRLRAGITGQYLVEDRVLLETAEDAYSPLKQLELRKEVLQLPAVLDSRRETLSGQIQLPVQADVVADARFLPDFPRVIRQGDGVVLEQGGMLQILYYDPDGRLQNAVHRWTGTGTTAADPAAALRMLPLTAKTDLHPGADALTVTCETGVQLTASGGQGIEMIAELKEGEPIPADPDRPSLILRRAGPEGLWALARACGSTEDAIRRANGLEGEPEPGRMLLIPVIAAS